MNNQPQQRPPQGQLPQGQPPQRQPSQGDDPQNNPAGGPKLSHIILIFFLITFALNALTSMLFVGNNTVQVEYSKFLALVDAGYVSYVQMDEAQLTFALKEDADTQGVGDILLAEGQSAQDYKGSFTDLAYYTGIMDDPGLTARLEAHGVAFTAPVVRSSPILSFISSWIMPILMLYLVYMLLFRVFAKRAGGMGGASGMLGMGKSTAKEYTMEQSTGVTFADVAGQDEAKESLRELVDFLHDPKKYEEMGAKQPKGALLVGPPGTGKTLLAKAVAGEAKVPFYSISGSEFVEMFVGLGASRVRDLFAQAKKNAPCIIFIDEIDAIGKSRDNRMGNNDEREQTLNQLLAEMDGFDSSTNIVILAATNRPEVLDKALLRPGRFDRRVIVDKPDLPGREAILKVHGAKVRLGPDVDLRKMALNTSGATGADLANMINEGALRAVKLGHAYVTQADLMESVEVVIAGKEKKDRVLSDAERNMVSYHEVGHALVSALQKNATPVQKITIVPRTMGSLGYTMNAPEDERYLMTKEDLLAQIATLLGGRAAEILVFNTETTGASNDIERATKMARSMVTQYGMSKTFGPISLESTESQYLDGQSVMNCSAQTAAEIDAEVRGILDRCQKQALELLSQNRDALDRISQYLLEKENITGEEFMSILKGGQP